MTSKTVDYTKIKAIIFDVDGVLTDGKITYDAQGKEIKSFNVKDGQMLKFMRSKGYIFGAISGRNSEALLWRLNELNIEFVRVSVNDKLSKLNEFLAIYNLSLENICYIGDDIIDLSVLKRVGFAVVPKDAASCVMPYANLVTEAKGGEGVVREVIDLIMAKLGFWEDLIASK